MKIRVLRVLEYVYSDVETMEKDMGRWGLAANGTHRAGANLTIKSSVLPLETIEDAEEATRNERDSMHVAALIEEGGF